MFHLPLISAQVPANFAPASLLAGSNRRANLLNSPLLADSSGRGIYPNIILGAPHGPLQIGGKELLESYSPFQNTNLSNTLENVTVLPLDGSFGGPSGAFPRRSPSDKHSISKAKPIKEERIKINNRTFINYNEEYATAQGFDQASK